MALTAGLLGLSACQTGTAPQNETEMATAETPEIPHDQHSYAKPEEALVKHLSWQARVDFDEKIIEATAAWDIEPAENAEQIIFDTYDLNIQTVKVDGEEVEFSLGEQDQHMGQALSIPIEPSSKVVHIKYYTSPGARALQWLSAEQTAGKEMPFLFTQGLNS